MYVAILLVLQSVLQVSIKLVTYHCNLLYLLYMSNTHECMGVNGEALQLHAVYKKAYFYCKSRENLNQYYKSHENLYIRYCKSHVLRLNVQ